MPRYFFDINDGKTCPDEEGVECANFEAARHEAMASLPEFARFAIPRDGDHQAFSMAVRDEDGVTVYTATLTFTAVNLRASAASLGSSATDS